MKHWCAHQTPMWSASFFWPGPDSSRTTPRRPAMVISSASAAPRTSGPAPAETGDRWRPAARRGCATTRRCPGRSRRCAARQQPFGRDGARPSERAPDVLVMDECLDQGDPSAQRCGQPPRLQVICQQGQQLLRAARIASRQAGDGDLAGTEPAPGHMRYQAARVELVVADDVGSHISDPPPRAPRRRLPLQRRQRREERGEVRPFVSRQTSQSRFGGRVQPRDARADR